MSAQSLLRPSRELREGTDNSFPKWAELTLRECKAREVLDGHLACVAREVSNGGVADR